MLDFDSMKSSIAARGAKMKYSGHKDLIVYQLAYQTAIEIYNETMNFPRDEKYSLIDQIRRSSRSVASNIAESWGKRMYPNHFVSKLSDSYAESLETQTWLDFSLSHNYLTKERYGYLHGNYARICAMLFNMMRRPDKFLISI